VVLAARRGGGGRGMNSGYYPYETLRKGQADASVCFPVLTRKRGERGNQHFEVERGWNWGVGLWGGVASRWWEIVKEAYPMSYPRAYSTKASQRLPTYYVPDALGQGYLQPCRMKSPKSPKSTKPHIHSLQAQVLPYTTPLPKVCTLPIVPCYAPPY